VLPFLELKEIRRCFQQSLRPAVAAAETTATLGPVEVAVLAVAAPHICPLRPHNPVAPATLHRLARRKVIVAVLAPATSGPPTAPAAAVARLPSVVLAQALVVAMAARARRPQYQDLPSHTLVAAAVRHLIQRVARVVLAAVAMQVVLMEAMGPKTEVAAVALLNRTSAETAVQAAQAS
jgi:hypothetical protein